jgi:hypothetical protein
MAELMALLPEDLLDGLRLWAANVPTTDAGWETVRVFWIGPGPDEEERARERSHLRRVADGLRMIFGPNV